jgi:Zn-dependent protease
LNILTTALYYLLEVLKWLILARVLVSWLPMLNIHVDRSHPVLGILYQITDPILSPLSRFSRIGNLDLSPIIAFFLISFLQNFLVGRSLSQTIAFAVALIIAFSVHECAHAWTAYQLGDSTAKNQGRLTLDPRKHLDVLGTVMVLTVGFGWAKPVPVNPYNLRNGPKLGMAIVAVAGPISNLILAAIAAIPLRLGMVPMLYQSSLFPDPQELFYTFVYLNIILMVFNLIPIAPLDGFNVLVGLLPYPASESLRKLAPAGPLILLLLIFFGGRVFTGLVTAPTRLIMNMLL